MFECYENDLFGLICLYIKKKSIVYSARMARGKFIYEKTDLELLGVEQLEFSFLFITISYIPK